MEYAEKERNVIAVHSRYQFYQLVMLTESPEGEGGGGGGEVGSHFPVPFYEKSHSHLGFFQNSHSHFKCSI